MRKVDNNSMNTQQKQQKGFTIIEVILVLAIAALIFLMVFIAVPALNSGQRDTARKQDVGTVASAIQNYVSNNQGTFPSTTNLTGVASGALQATGGYVNKSTVSNNTKTVTVLTAATTTITPTQGTITIEDGYKCSAGGASETVAASASNFVVVTYLETGGGQAFCQTS